MTHQALWHAEPAVEDDQREERVEVQRVVLHLSQQEALDGPLQPRIREALRRHAHAALHLQVLLLTQCARSAGRAL